MGDHVRCMRSRANLTPVGRLFVSHCAQASYDSSFAWSVGTCTQMQNTQSCSHARSVTMPKEIA
eukprot:6212348-Pleurochrysis_carterae.AAC.2